MDLKREAARAGATLITSQQHIGLGEGGTIAFLVAEIAGQSPVRGRQFYTSSVKTARLLGDAGFSVGELETTSSIDLYFDGCDQVDHALNALKSGAGIHTMEKLLAVMATEFVLLADESKYVPVFDGKHPLVVEFIPEALGLVKARLDILSPGLRVALRKTGGAPLLTSHGNWLIDAWLPDWRNGASFAAAVKNLPGVLETSLFTGIAKKAVIAGEKGTRIVTAVTDSTNK